MTAVFALAFISVFFYMRKQLIQRAEYDAWRDLDIASNLINDRLDMARTALVNSVVPQGVGDSKRIVENMLRQNGDIYGTAIAIQPEYARRYLGKERYMIYSRRTAADTLNTFVLSDSVEKYFHYPERDWYVYPISHGEGHWTEPYYDSLTTGALMVSYSVPIIAADSVPIGVLLADITLEEGINRIVHDIDSASAYRTYLLSAERQLVFGDTTELQDDVVYTKYMAETGWTLGHVIDKQTLFSPIYKTILNLTLLFVLTVLVLWMTIYYVISWMTRPAVKKQIRIKAELDIAARIQEGMLPKAVLPSKDCENLDVAALIQPAKEVGGDFYNYLFDNDKFYFIIGDVSGKGVPAALIMSITTELFMVSAPGKSNPKDIVESINNVLTRDNHENMFVTMIVGIIDSRRGKMTLCNAGHNMPIAITDGKPTMLKLRTNIPTGVISDFAYEDDEFDFSCQPSYGKEPIGSRFSPNSLIVLYTDGVTEAENSRHGQYGKTRLMGIIESQTEKSLLAPSAQTLCAAIEKDIHGFVNGFEQNDDITIFIIGKSE